MEHQRKKAEITPEMLKNYFNPDREFNHTRPIREPIELLSDEEYAKMGINFDRYFGFYSK